MEAQGFKTVSLQPLKGSLLVKDSSFFFSRTGLSKGIEHVNLPVLLP